MSYGKREGWWDSDALMDTLRLSTEDYSAILNELTRDKRTINPVECREHERMQFCSKRAVLQLKHADTHRPPYRVLPNDVSAGGASVLHGFFVSAGTPCDLALQQLDGKMLSTAGTVVRCRHIVAKVHELGISFSRRLDLSQLIQDQDAKVEAENEAEADLGQFSGDVLLIDEREEDRELFSFMAEELGATPHTVAQPDEARDVIANNSVDLVLVRLGLPDGGAAAVAGKLREWGHHGAVHAVSCASSSSDQDEDARLQAEALAQGCNGIVSAPLTRDRLADVFTGILHREYSGAGGGTTLYSRHWSNAKMRPLIKKFVTILDSRVRQLENLLAQEQLEEFQRACQQLGESSTSYGFDEIAQKLTELNAMVASNKPAEELRPQLAELAQLSASARLPSAGKR